MADLTPSDPRSLFETAADNVAGFSTRKPETFPTEIRERDLDAWLMDPREQEQDHTGEGAGQRMYNRVPIEYVVYIVTEGGEGKRSDARAALDSLRDDYLTQLHDTFEANGGFGQVQKTGRVRSEIKNGETALMVDAISFEVSQQQDY